MWTGRSLYHDWCGSSTTDRALYFDRMNPADQQAWDELADRLNKEAKPQERIPRNTIVIYRAPERGRGNPDLLQAVAGADAAIRIWGDGSASVIKDREGEDGYQLRTYGVPASVMALHRARAALLDIIRQPENAREKAQTALDVIETTLNDSSEIDESQADEAEQGDVARDKLIRAIEVAVRPLDSGPTLGAFGIAAEDCALAHIDYFFGVSMARMVLLNAVAEAMGLSAPEVAEQFNLPEPTPCDCKACIGLEAAAKAREKHRAAYTNVAVWKPER